MRNTKIRTIRTLAPCLSLAGALSGCGDFDTSEAAGSSEHRLAFGGVSAPVPGRVEAERFDQGGPGVGYFDTSVGNSGGQFRSENVDIEASAHGGFNVGWIAQGEWLAYGVNVASAGRYDLTLSVASLAAPGALHLEVGGVNVSGPIAFPATGGYQAWTQVKVESVALPAGSQVIRLVADSANFNVDWFELSRAATGDPTCSSGIPNGERTVCCAASCGACGGTGCDQRPGGAAACCTSGVSAAGASCSGSLPPCVLTGGTTPPSGAILAKTAAAGMANGFNVGNTFETNQHPRTASSVNAMIDAYYAEGFRTVRVPIRWIGSGFADGDLASATGLVNKAHARLGVIQSIVDYAIGKGMYVVINTHHDNWLFDSPWSTAKYGVHSNLWAGICDVFKNRSHRLMFEVINEPHGSIRFDAAVVRTINKNAYDVIRACGGNNATRIVILDGIDWGGPTSLQNTWPQVTQIPGAGNDAYLMGSIHFYDPLDLTHADSAAGINVGWTVAEIQTKLNSASAWAAGKLPVFVGEFGVNWNQHAKALNTNTFNWYKAVADQTRARGWAFTVWDDGGWFRVMDRSTRAFNGLQNACVP